MVLNRVPGGPWAAADRPRAVDTLSRVSGEPPSGDEEQQGLHGAEGADAPDDLDDPEASGLPPHPLDRVWFHPSELSARLGTEVPAPAPPRPPGRDWGLAAITAVAAMVATLAVVAATGAFSSDGGNREQASIATSVLGLGDGPSVTDLVSANHGSVVAVRATSTDPAVAPVTASGVALSRTEVLTSATVVAGARAVTVAADGRVLTATIAGVDPSTDLALLRVPDAELTPGTFGTSDDLEVGQTVVGIGMAGGDHRWAAEGVVSSLGRLVTSGAGVVMAGLVETDLRPGTPVAGGAIVDAEGHVVGVLTGAAAGRAVPIDWARDLAQELAASGQVRHGYLGVDATDAGDRPGGGARITVVAPDGPAGAAGLAPGDVVTTLAGDRVSDVADLLAAVARRHPGDPVDVIVWRGDGRSTIKVTLGERMLVSTPVAAFAR